MRSRQSTDAIKHRYEVTRSPLHRYSSIHTMSRFKSLLVSLCLAASLITLGNCLRSKVDCKKALPTSDMCWQKISFITNRTTIPRTVQEFDKVFCTPLIENLQCAFARRHCYTGMFLFCHSSIQTNLFITLII